MRKLIICFGFILLILPCILADRLVPVEVPVSIEFEDERKFVLQLPNGLERQFIWDENETHSDVSFTHIMYKDIDEEEWCGDNTELDEYKALLETNDKMLATCTDIVGQLNQTIKFQKEADEAIKDRDIYDNLLDSCKDDLKEYRNKTIDCERDLGEEQDEHDSCESQLTTLQRQKTDYQACDDSLADAESSKNAWGFGGAILGIIGGYFMWGRKKGGGPSEHAETGYSYDAPSNYNQDGPGQ